MILSEKVCMAFKVTGCFFINKTHIYVVKHDRSTRLIALYNIFSFIGIAAYSLAYSEKMNMNGNRQKMLGII